MLSIIGYRNARRQVSGVASMIFAACMICPSGTPHTRGQAAAMRMW